jgi:hypothetical protein
VLKSAHIVLSVLLWSPFAHTARPNDREVTNLIATVIDPTGAAIPGAEVWIGGASDSLKPFIIANDRGAMVAHIEPGNYELAAEAPGFRTERQQVTVLHTTEQHLNISLQVGGCSPCVVVENMPVPEPAVSLPSLSINEAPAECRGNATHPGPPVFSKSEKGIRYGLSLPQNHVVVPFPVPLYVWVNNTSDQDVNASDGCDLIMHAGIRIKSIRGRDARKHVASRGSRICSAAVPVRIPAHSCFAFAKVHLNEMYELRSGVYAVFPGSNGAQAKNGKQQKDRLFFQYQALVPSR